MQHFDWSANTLFFEATPNAKDESRTVFLLGGKDAIVDAHMSWLEDAHCVALLLQRFKTYLNRRGCPQ